MTTANNALAPTDAELLQEWDRVSHITDAGKRRLSVMRAVLAKWGARGPAASEAQPVAEDGVIFLSGKAAGRQEVKDEQQSPDFWTWIRQAYREPESTKFTIYNMEVAYQAGRETAASSVLVREPLSGERVKEILIDAGYGDYCTPAPERAAFISGLRHGELEHCITAAQKGGQHGAE